MKNQAYFYIIIYNLLTAYNKRFIITNQLGIVMQKINILKNNTKNIIIAISFILIISIIYIVPFVTIDIYKLTNNLSNLEMFFNNEFVFLLKILFSFLIPISFFTLNILFSLNKICLKSTIITAIIIFIISIYLYNLPYELLIKMTISKEYIKLLIHIFSANMLIIFALSLSYIKYNIKQISNLYDFYTMIAEIVIWAFLLYFVLFIIFMSIFALMKFNNQLDIKKLTIFLVKNNMLNLKIFYSIFIILSSSILYCAYLLYNKMTNTKLSITISRTISIFISISSLSLIILNLKNNILSSHKLFFYLYALFLIIFIKIIFLFRADKKLDKYEYICYIISNIFIIIFSLFLIINNVSNIKFFIAIIIFNAIYNIILTIIKKREFIFYYNFVYIILFIILLLT